jgi:hypothetical protein
MTLLLLRRNGGRSTTHRIFDEFLEFARPPTARRPVGRCATLQKLVKRGIPNKFVG